MNPAVASLIALIAAIVLSMVTRLNVGVVSLVFAWLVGVYGAHLNVDAVFRGFPSSLFLTLFGMTLLFGAAEANATLERLAQASVRLTRGRASLLPILFFAIACVISAIGPGAVSSVALVAPLAMAIGARAGVPAFLSALVITNGANAGNLSPISAVGVIANSRMAAAGLGGHAGKVMVANFAASALVALGAYLALGGLALRHREAAGTTVAGAGTFTRHQRLTIVVLVAWIAGVVALGLNPGLSALVGAIALFVLRCADESAAVKRVPWGVIVMVCGVATLIALLETTGGMALFTALLARLASPRTVNGVIAFVTGAISLYSSTSGVVLPAFLPAVPGLVQKVGGGDPLAVALSVNVGSSLVDVSPLSTLGALCLATIADGAEARALFRQLLLWGVSMALAGAILCQWLAGPLARL